MTPFRNEKNSNWEGAFRVPAMVRRPQFLGTFREFPPRQKAASFTIDQVVEKMMAAAGGGGR
jgi:arylsulfatase